MEERENIRERLKKHKLSYVWLIGQLALRGIVTDKTEMSSVISGTRNGTKADAIIEFCYCMRFFLWCRFESLHFPDPRQSRDACALTGYLYTAQRVCLVLFFLFLKRSLFFQVIKYGGYRLP